MGPTLTVFGLRLNCGLVMLNAGVQKSHFQRALGCVRGPHKKKIGLKLYLSPVLK